MSEKWARRQRNTNHLIRAIAGHLFDEKTVGVDQLYGLCKLTWITKSFADEHASYIKSTKIPALSEIFGLDFEKLSLSEVADDVSVITGIVGIKQLILNHTGFTNFYSAYRNSSKTWIGENFEEILTLFKDAYALKNDDQGKELIQRIEYLPGIPKGNRLDQQMNPGNLLTPVLFSLDQRIRFPLINGNKNVQTLLTALGVKRSHLDVQYEKMIELYGKGGIVDAADLDQTREHLLSFIQTIKSEPSKRFLEEKPVEGNQLPLKDERDVLVIYDTKEVVAKRIHNTLTNKLKAALSDFTLLEGVDNSALFDVMVVGYSRGKAEKHDLLIEAKSSIEMADIRMAIGQLYSYWFHEKHTLEPHLAVLLPSEPGLAVKKLLEWRDIGILWFDGNDLKTCSLKLKHLIHTSI